MKTALREIDRQEKAQKPEPGRRKEKDKKEKLELGLDFNIEEQLPRSRKRSQKRGGCTSGGSSGGLGGGPKLEVEIQVEHTSEEVKYEAVATRPIDENEEIKPGDVKKVRKRSRNALDYDQVVGKRATRDIPVAETVRNGMVKS